jgi:D-alanyl-D-alanine carboxypeptidase
MIAQPSFPCRAWSFHGSPLRRVALLLAALALFAGCSTTGSLEVAAPAPGPSARYSELVVDAASGQTLYQGNASAARYPASLTKMMTLYLLFEALDQGRLSRTTPIPVSQTAARQPPSKIGLKAGQTIDAESAILALTVKSANDVAVAVGEYLGGSEAEFARQMTARARQLGMTGTTFRNASGLPDPEQRTTARDMAVLGMALRSRFPQHYHYFSARDFSYRGRQVRGHNDLLGRVDGVDGIKTGYIKASGYNIVTSVNAGGRRLVIVVMGANSARARNDRVEALIAQYMRPPAGNAGSLIGALLFKN